MNKLKDQFKKFSNFKKKQGIFFGILFLVLLLVCCILSSCLLFSIRGGNEEFGKVYYEEVDIQNFIQTKKFGKIFADELLIVFREDTSKNKIKKLVKSINGEILGQVEFIGLYQIRTKIRSEEKLLSLINHLKRSEIVEEVGPEAFLYLKDISGTPCTIYEDMYTVGDNAEVFQMVRLEEAWKYIRASGVKLHDVRVGVTDSGLNTTSEELKGKVKISALTNDDVNNIPDIDKKGNWDIGGYNHGTAVTNMIGADWSNGGTIGVAGGLEDKLSIAVSNLEAGGSEYTQINQDEEDLSQIKYYGVSYTVKTFAKMINQIENGATVINYSWGSEFPDSGNGFENKIFKKFLAKVYKKYPKVLFVAAAGNEASKGIALDGTNYDLGGTPAPNLITVGSVDREGKRSWFSNKVAGGGEISLVAVGSEVPAVIGKKEQQGVKISGTSFATPQVSGAAAILRSINPDLTAAEIKDILVKTAKTEIKIGGKNKQIDPEAGGPLLQIHKAVLEVINDVRAKDKLSEIKEDDLNKLAYIEAKAIQNQENPLQYQILAKLDKVRRGGADVRIDMTGFGAYFGRSVKHLSTPGKLNWGFEFTDDQDHAVLKLTRLDSGACSKISLTPLPFYVGEFRGNMHFDIDNTFSRWSSLFGNDDFDVALQGEIKQDKTIRLNLNGDSSYSATTPDGFPATITVHVDGTVHGTYNEEDNIIEASGLYDIQGHIKRPPEAGGNDSLSINDADGFRLNGSYNQAKFEGNCVMIDKSDTLTGNFYLQKK